MPKKTIKAFTLLELLVVIGILGIFTVIAYPNISKWITDREVKKEVYDFVNEINEMKAKVTSGEYALAMVRFTDYNNGYFHYALMKKYYMTKDDFAHNYPIKNMATGANGYWYCDYDIRNQRYQSVGNYTSDSIRHWPNIHMCISKDGTKKGVLNQKNPDTGQRRTLSRVIFCSASNTTNSSGSNRCNDSNKNDFRYMVTWDVFANLKVYKFNMKKNKWCAGKVCRSMSEFN